MNSRLKMKSKLLKMMAAGLIFLGCAGRPNWVELDQAGFNKFIIGAETMQQSPENLDYVVKIKNLEIRYCDVNLIKNLFGPDKARVGLAWSDGEKNIVWIPAKIVDGEIMPNRAILGHEIYNITRFNDKNGKVHNVYQYFEK